MRHTRGRSFAGRLRRKKFFGLCILIGLVPVAHTVPKDPASDARLGLPTLSAVTDRGSAEELTSLGNRVFFDARFSADGKLSCAKCHLPGLAFSDGRTRSVGHNGATGTRNTASLLNVAYATTLFWDGRAADLDTRALAPSLRNVAITAPYMHGGSVKTLEEAVDAEFYNRTTEMSYPIALTVSERQDLVEFLKSLTSPYATAMSTARGHHGR